MSTLKTSNVQVGQSGTATNNFTLYQPTSPDGTVRLGVGNSGATTSDVLTITNAGNATFSGSVTATGGFIGAGLTLQAVQTSNFAASAAKSYPVDTTSGAVTVTLPSSPTAGDQVNIFDYAGTAATNNITINPNGGKITSGTANVALNVSRISITLIYVNSTQGWEPVTYNSYSNLNGKSWTYFTSSGTYTVPAGVTSIRGYAGGKGGNGASGGGDNSAGGGGGGGFAYGDIAVTPGQTVTVTISSGVATLAIGATTYLTGNPGSNASGTSGGSGGTASKDASVTNGGAYSGGSGGSITTAIRSGGGGGSCGSPLGNGYAGGGYTGTNAFTQGFGGGIGSAGTTTTAGGNTGPRTFNARYTEPLLSVVNSYTTIDLAGGSGGLMGGGNGNITSTGGNGGLGGGAGGSGYGGTGGTGGGAFVFIYA